MTYATTLTATQTQTFTIADAKYLASRIATDLDQIRLYYGHIATSLTEQRIQEFAVEAAVLLKFGLLSSVKYGFRKANDWKFYVNYKVNHLGQLEASNDAPGDIDPNAPVEGSSFYSHLTTRNNPNLTAEEEASIHASLPVQRGTGDEPSSANGTLSNDKSFYRNGIGMDRSQFRSYQ